MGVNRWDHPGWGARAKTREELEQTHRIVSVRKWDGHEIAFTVSRFRSHEEYLDVVKQAERSMEV